MDSNFKLKKASPDSSPESNYLHPQNKFSISLPARPVFKDSTWCADATDNDESTEEQWADSQFVGEVNAASTLPGRARREWNGIDIDWNVAPKLTKVCHSTYLAAVFSLIRSFPFSYPFSFLMSQEEIRRYVGNCTSLIIFDEAGVNDPFDPCYLRLGKLWAIATLDIVLLDRESDQFRHCGQTSGGAFV